MVSNNPPPRDHDRNNQGRPPRDPMRHLSQLAANHNKLSQPPKPLKPTKPIAQSHDGDQFLTEQPSLANAPKPNTPPAKPTPNSTQKPANPANPSTPNLRLVGSHDPASKHASKHAPKHTPKPIRTSQSHRLSPAAAKLARDYSARTPFGSTEPAASSISASGVMLDLSPVGQPIATATDPRWVLALRTAEALQGSVLPPEQRQKLIRLGKVMGMTAFDANLVIAIIQDQARRGYAADYCPTAGEPQLQMVPLPRLNSVLSNFPGRRMLMLACAIAAVLAIEIIFFKWWLGA